MQRTVLVLSALILLALSAGCGGKANLSTPEGAAQAYLDAVKAGDAKALSQLYDYTTYARGQNPDWDAIPPGQRDLIIRKVAEDRAKELEGQMQQLQADLKDATVGPVSAGESQASVKLEGAPQVGSLTLVRQGEKWYIALP